MPEAVPRPAQVTIAAWLVMAGSVIVVVTAFDQVAGLHTMETREAVEDFLDDGLGKSLGLDVQGALTAMRVLSMVAAACATAAAILGYQILQRSRSARMVLTILAAPLFVTGVVVGGLVPAMVVGAIVMLWFQPARDWVDGKTPRPVPARAAASPPPPPARTTPPAATPTPTGSGEPRAVTGFGAPVSLLDSLPPPRTAPIGAAPFRLSGRPAALTWACVLTWVGAGLTFVAMLATTVVMIASPDVVVDELLRQNPSLEDDGLTAESLRSTVLYASSLLVLWSLVAMVLAGYAWTGRQWAWTGLVVSSSSAALLGVLAALTNPVLLLPVGVCVAATVLLLRPEVRAFVNRSG
jgi:hypothetical protein